jgi:hypothetical protein
MGIDIFWTVVGTMLLVGVVSSVTGRRRRRQQLIQIYENPGAIHVVKAADTSHRVHRAADG